MTFYHTGFCHCNEGYYGDGGHCEDDRHAHPEHPCYDCHRHAYCDEGDTCRCHDGYQGRLDPTFSMIFITNIKAPI